MKLCRLGAYSRITIACTQEWVKISFKIDHVDCPNVQLFNPLRTKLNKLGVEKMSG